MKESLRSIIIIVILLTSMTICVAQNKYALLVGISNYHSIDKNNAWNDIHGANDVQLISPILKKQGFSLKCLIDTKATHANIIQKLSNLSKKVREGAIVYLHFSCHGQPFQDMDGD